MGTMANSEEPVTSKHICSFMGNSIGLKTKRVKSDTVVFFVLKIFLVHNLLYRSI